jgi:hypothetical protein
MKRSQISLLIFSIFLSVVSCESSEGNSSSEKEKEITINQPPSGDYFIGVQDGELSNENQPAWTEDFVTYTQITDEFEDGIANLWLDNDTLVILGYQNISTDAKYDIHFASINDLKNFRTVKSIYNIEYAAIINGTLVAYNVFNQLGYCEAGNSDITWLAKLATGTQINGPFRVSRGEIIAAANINGVSGIAKSSDSGLTWNINTVAYGDGDIELIDGKSWSRGSTSWGYISSNDFANGTWTSDSFSESLEGNTTNVTGQFKVGSSKILMHDSDWRIYGYIEKDSANTLYHYAAVNKSTDDGLTWTTSLLTGSSDNPEKIQGRVRSTSSLTIIEYAVDGTHLTDYYSSTDGVSFTKIIVSDAFRNNMNNNWQFVR